MNKEITHTKVTFKAIPNGFLNRLAKLTSRTADNSKMSINKSYPGNNRVLAKVRLNMKIFPNLKELWENADER